MGRVIRHRRDYGAIILCDERFRPEAARRQLSCWLRGLVQVYPNFGQASGSLTKFFKVGSLCSSVAAFVVPCWLRGLKQVFFWLICSCLFNVGSLLGGAAASLLPSGAAGASTCAHLGLPTKCILGSWTEPVPR